VTDSFPARSAVQPALPFASMYRHGFVRTAVAIPRVHIAEPARNAEATIELAGRAAADHAALCIFPELGLSGYSIDDLFHQEALLEAVLDGLAAVVEASRSMMTVLIVGAPLRNGNGLFNCAVVLHRGQILGVVPKSYLPTYREFYEKRQFLAARDSLVDEIELFGPKVAFGSDVLFQCSDVDGFAIHVEICEDLWVPIPPSSSGALAGATVLANLSASNIVVDKAGYRRLLCQSQSARCVAGYLYSAAGSGESTTDLAWDGQGLICENGDLLAEGERFSPDPQLITADIDVGRLVSDRMGLSSFHDAGHDHARRLRRFRTVGFALGPPVQEVELRREIARFPYVPSDPVGLAERCSEVYNIQVQGLASRLAATGIEQLVIGVSGGLDSTHALIVSVKAMDRLGLPRQNVLAYTMPGFATSAATRTNALRLMEALRVSASEIDIRPSAQQMLADIEHPAAEGEAVYDLTYENVQAGERTSHLFRLANLHHGLVVGTGDLSELALGWATYGVGDQMSHYNPNASVPKTLISYLIRWVLDTGEVGPAAQEVLGEILATEISPELVPAGEGGVIQNSEAKIGPYELQDFNLYYTLRFGYPPSRIAYLAQRAWADRGLGHWPDLLPPEGRHQYDLATIKSWLGVFLLRFFQTSQFKRSALPNAPKVGSGGSLSPRGDWRAPSDSSARTWLDELEANVPD
jgi:NAD+ synthase (glutamine-hydrolysing)